MTVWSGAVLATLHDCTDARYVGRAEMIVIADEVVHNVFALIPVSQAEHVPKFMQVKRARLIFVGLRNEFDAEDGAAFHNLLRVLPDLGGGGKSDRPLVEQRGLVLRHEGDVDVSLARMLVAGKDKGGVVVDRWYFAYVSECQAGYIRPFVEISCDLAASYRRFAGREA